MKELDILPLEEKDTIAREKWNKEISRTLYSNTYNRETLKAEIDALTEKKKTLEAAQEALDVDYEKLMMFQG